MTYPSPFLPRLIPRLIHSGKFLRAISQSYKFSTRPYPTTPTCPAPTCECAESPQVPTGYKIDREKPLHGHVPLYREQVLVCTGRDDWASRIEFEVNSRDEVNMAGELKAAFGRGGKFCDPFTPISIHNVSFPPTSPPPSSSLYLLPSFTYIPKFVPENIPALARTLGHPWPPPRHLFNGSTAVTSDVGTSSPKAQQNQPLMPGVQEVSDIMILICGHRGRDLRCGIYGPILRREFQRKLMRANIPVRRVTAATKKQTMAQVGLISHIGGHAFAGNVIIYIPPSGLLGHQPHPLAGCGVWYGRVEPNHVEGIIKETVLGGRIIEELFRGGINPSRNIF